MLADLCHHTPYHHLKFNRLENMQSHYLTPLFSPNSIAMFGASDRENSVGEVVFRNILSCGFQGGIYPVNPKHDTVQGQKAYKTLEEIGKPVDLAVVATPAKTIPAIVEACGQYGATECHRASMPPPM